MNNVLQFPVKRAQPGSVFCRPLKLAFPCLYRVHVQSTVAQQRAYFGNQVPDDLQFADFERVFFTLDPDASDVGTITRTIVTHLDPKDVTHSVLIRHHADESSAWSYLDAMSDLEFDEQVEDSDTSSCLYESPEGFFTSIRRVTPKAAHGPVVIRMANIPAPEGVFCERDWVHIMSHEGQELSPNDFGYGDLR